MALSMSSIVRAVTENELVVITGEVQGRGQLFVCEGPMAMKIIEVVFSFLKEDSNGFREDFADQRLVVVPTPNIGEAANMAQDFGNGIGSFPRRCEGADSS